MDVLEESFVVGLTIFIVYSTLSAPKKVRVGSEVSRYVNSSRTLAEVHSFLDCKGCFSTSDAVRDIHLYYYSWRVCMVTRYLDKGENPASSIKLA